MTDKSRILLLEDDRHIALALQIRLNASGYEVSLAANVAEAHRYLDSFMPDAAVLDYNLPDGNGIDVMKAMRSMQADNNLTIVFMTASRANGLHDRAMSNGADSVLEKPFGAAALLDSLSAVEPIKRCA